MGGVPAPGVVPGAMVPGVTPQAGASAPDLVMDTADTQWGGDLGAFLRSKLATSRARHLRVRVVGTGSHRFTPVRLPDGMTLEIQVIATGGPRPSWSPDPLATGPGLIELHDGALVLANFVVRHDPNSKIESLLHLEGSHLILFRCQLTVPPEPAVPAGDLIVFGAGTSRPMARQPGDAVLRGPAVRPVCRLIDTILIANHTAIRAELGRGLIAMTRCAIAADETALALDPGDVARAAFAADVWLERCTLVSGHSIVRLGPWPGLRRGSLPALPAQLPALCLPHALRRPVPPSRAAPRRRGRLGGRVPLLAGRWRCVRARSHRDRRRGAAGGERVRRRLCPVGAVLGLQSSRPDGGRPA